MLVYMPQKLNNNINENNNEYLNDEKQNKKKANNLHKHTAMEFDTN